VDITKQKQAEAALVASEERRASIRGQTGEGFILIDQASGAITDSNPEFQKLTGRHAGS
jgi:PAS domain-containing protein